MDIEFYTLFFLRLLVVIIGFTIGKRVSATTQKNYFLCVLPFILAFALNEGLRFGRGVDYNGYYFKYLSILDSETGDRIISDPVFVTLCHLNDLIGLPYQGLVFIFSLILAISGVILLKDNKNVLLYAFHCSFYILCLPRT